MNSFDLMIEKYKKEMQDMNQKFAPSPSYENPEKKIEDKPNSILAVPTTVETTKEQEPQLQLQEVSQPPQQKALGEGGLVVQAFMSDEVYPIVSAFVEIYDGESEDLLLDDFTDVSGKTNKFSLPAPSEELSQTPNSTRPYAVYDVVVSHPKYKTRKYISVPVFDKIESVQPVELVPIESSNIAEDVIVTRDYNLGGI